MQIKTLTAGEMLQIAVSAIEQRDKNIPQVLDSLPAAIYITNSQGILVHYNRACIAFAGRMPHVGQDSWCVTWKLYTDEGEFLPHDQCPMAVAIRERRAIRGIEAVAKRPDGTHVRFRPYPTPLLDEEGKLTGAINLLLDVTGLKEAQTLRTQAARCRRLVNLMHDQHSVDILAAMAVKYDQQALRIEQVH